MLSFKVPEYENKGNKTSLPNGIVFEETKKKKDSITFTSTR